MKSLLILSLSVATAVFASSQAAPPVEDLSPKAARAQARRDFASGHPQIYKAGGFEIFEPGITEEQKKLVAHLPRNGSLAGCTNPKGLQAVEFATAYNQEIVILVQKSGQKSHGNGTATPQR